MKRSFIYTGLLIFALCSFAQAAGTSKIYKFSQTDTGSNLLTDTVYGASNYTDRTIGNAPGIAKSRLVNKALRQGTAIASGLAYFLAATLDGIVITDNDTAAKISGHINDALDVAITLKTAAVADHTAQLAAEIGDCKSTIRLSAPAKWLLCDGKTIGNAASNATARANADTVTLYGLLWVLPNASIPIYTSAGVLSSRGGSAAADYAANKAIALPDMRARVAVGVNTSGDIETDGNGTVQRSNKALASVGGEELDLLNPWTIPKHTHPSPGDTSVEGQPHTHNVLAAGRYPVYDYYATGSKQAVSRFGSSETYTTGPELANHTHSIPVIPEQSVGGYPHNTLQPYITLNYIIKYQ